LRVYNFHHNTMHALQELLQAAGVKNPYDLKAHHIVKRVSATEVTLLSNVLDFLEPGDLLSGNYKYKVFKNWWDKAHADTFELGQH